MGTPQWELHGDNFTQVPKPAILLEKRLWHRCFRLNFAKFLRTAVLKEHLRWLLLALLTCNLQALFLTCRFFYNLSERIQTRTN